MKKKRVKWNLNTKLRQSLRMLWLRSPMRYEAIKRTRCMPGRNMCEQCKKIVATKDIKIDHIVPAGTLINDISGFVKRLMVESHGLQALCETCHDKKTSEERAN